MTILFSRKSSCFFLVFLLFSFSSESQNVKGFIQPQIDLNWEPPTGRWSYHFALGNKDLLYEENDTKFEVQHLEITHLTAYEIGFYGKVALGIRYRWRELFDESKRDELRLMQQYSHKRNFNRLVIAYRFRLEERFRENTGFRSRYRFSAEFPFNGDRVDSNEFFLIVETEALWSLGKYQIPSFDQRMGLYIGNRIFQNVAGEVGLEYRLKDYTKNTNSELLLSTTLSISI